MKKIEILVLGIIVTFLVSCGNNNVEVKETYDTIEYAAEPEYDTETINEEIETEHIANDFESVLEGIKDVHPGSAGCSLKVLYANCKLLNACKAKLPFEMIANAWVALQDEDDYADLNESFNYALESLQTLREGDIEKVMGDNGIEDFVSVWDSETFDIAENVLYTIINQLP